MSHIEAEQLRPSLSSSRYWMAPRMGSLSVAWCCRAVFDRRESADSQSDEVGDLVDVTTLAVALIGVGGTLGGTLGGALLSQRVTREQNQRADRERAEDRHDRAQEARRDLYARLNTTARAYRVAARDAVRAAERGESVEPAVLDAAKEAWAEQYSLAQMALPKVVHEIASSLNRALGVGYTVVKQLPSTPNRVEAYSRAKDWFSGALSDGVYLLRVTLRHDLGVEVEPDFERTRTRMLTVLDTERRSLERLLASEQATRPV
ncbi:hypothetical protein ACFY5K_13380 [Streptomyces griseofuscus]|uniref:hypothetical protein n=1 Tax=Streptomyces griseofuscus TaxID=146922 RepID=UPI0036866E08